MMHGQPSIKNPTSAFSSNVYFNEKYPLFKNWFILR